MLEQPSLEYSSFSKSKDLDFGLILLTADALLDTS